MCEAYVIPLLQTVAKARTTGPLSVDEILAMRFSSVVAGISIGIQNARGLREECKSSMMDLYVGCAAQFLYLFNVSKLEDSTVLALALHENAQH